MEKPTAAAIRDFDITGKIGDLYPPNYAAINAATSLIEAAERADGVILLELLNAAKDALDKTVPEWPMYSYSHPAYLLWNAIGRELFAAGWSEKRIKKWLASKATRWALDRDLGDDIAALGKAYAAKMSAAYPRNQPGGHAAGRWRIE